MSKQKKKIPANKPEQSEEVVTSPVNVMPPERTADVRIDKINFLDELKDLYPMSDSQIDQMADDITANGLITPVTLRAKDDCTYDLIHGQLRVTACQSLGHETIKANFIPCSAENAVTMGIVANGQRPKNWVTVAKEVKYLLSRGKSLLPELRTEDPTIKRLFDGIAKRYGYDSKAFVYKMQEIIEADPILYVMHQLDTKELKSFEEAWRKATNQEEQGAEKAPNEKPFICNCPLVATCSKYAEWKRDQLDDVSTEEGGNNE